MDLWAGGVGWVESSPGIYTPPYAHTAAGLHEVRGSALRSWDLEGWDAAESKSGSKRKGIYVYVGDFCCCKKLTQQCKATIFQLKIKIVSKPDITKFFWSYLLLSTRFLKFTSTQMKNLILAWSSNHSPVHEIIQCCSSICLKLLSNIILPFMFNYLSKRMPTCSD